MKKELKKAISKIFPGGDAKEKLKLVYYNFKKSEGVGFELAKSNAGKRIYKTISGKINLFTNEALYPIVADFDYYQHFYKVKPDDIVIDAGANFGHLSIFFSKIVGPKGLVYAFEPDSLNAKRIKENISLNPDLEDNIKIVDLLLWDKNEIVDFYEAGTVGSSAVWIPDAVNTVKKESIRIDDWVKKNHISKIDFIKMDIEGAEIEALDGCVETIRELKPNFAIASYHVVNGEQTYIKVEDFFKRNNYPYKTVRFRKTEIITFAGPLTKK